MTKKIIVADLGLKVDAFLAAAEKTKKEIVSIREKMKTLKKTVGATSQTYIKQESELKRLNSTFTQQKNVINALKSPYAKLSKELQVARNKAKDLAVQFGMNDSRTKAMSRSVRNLDKRLKGIDNSLGQNQRSVGKYGEALRGVTSRFAGAALAATGLMMIIGGIFRAVGDAIKRITAFGKVMTNISAITGESRQELGDLETTIKNVASKSIKTSTEVAKLAETLIVLGKTKSEVIKLIKPTNNLSIALQASSEEAGNLLVQTLNAFGKSSDSANQYADVIAKMRTSTSLDFEKIKDALSFIAPTAKAAGVSLEGTAAIVGVLADNGIKAGRSGRLMSSSFLRLSKNGKTLGNGLEELRRVQNSGASSVDVLKTATELFGLRSAALGLILANNKDKLKELTAEFENSRGTLDKLTKIQLTSLSAKTKIFTSAWEKLILGVQNGDGWFSKVAKELTDFGTAIIKGITPAETLAEKFKRVSKETDNLQTSIKPLLEQYKNLNKKLALSDDEHKKLKKVIEEIGLLVPEAIINYDNYGNAISINTERVNKATKAQNLHLESIKKNRIEEVTVKLKEQTDQLAELHKFYVVGSDGVLRFQESLFKGNKTENKTIIVNKRGIGLYRDRLQLLQSNIDENNTLISSLNGVKDKTIKLTEEETKHNEIVKQATINSIMSMDATKKRVDLEKLSLTELSDLSNLILQAEEDKQTIKDAAAKQRRKDKKAQDKLDADAKIKKLQKDATALAEFKKAQQEQLLITQKEGLDKELALIDEAYRLKLEKAVKGSDEEALLLAQKRVEKEAAKNEATLVFEEERKALQDEIDLINAEDKATADEKKIQQQYEKDIKAINAKKLTEEQKTQMLVLEKKKRNKLLNKLEIENFKKKLKADLKVTESEKATARIRGLIARGLTRLLTGLLGKSLLAQIAGIAINAGIQAGLVKMQSAATSGKIAASLATANAGALATPTAISTFGLSALPVIAANSFTAATQQTLNATSTAAAITGIMGSAAIQGIGTIANSFYEGGQVSGGVNIPISMRNRGGDDVLIQAKKGEIVVNEQQQKRAGGNSFFSSIGVPGLASGGMVGNTATNTVTNNNLNIDAIVEKINNIKVVAIVDEIEVGLATKADIINEASI